MLNFTPTISMVVIGEKLGMDPWIGQPVCCGSGREPFLSEAVTLFNAADDYVKGCHVWGLFHRKHMNDIHGLVRKIYMSCVSSFPCRVYIDSKYRDSQA
jgi:hypothetical protein